ncbi:MAG: helix-turn-helix domain-containing protein [Chloroflexi bacterium]|nr:helix-turn-helix domain-containing protein [Chloroflexota bacterium]
MADLAHSVGRRLREAREAVGLSQEQLGQRLSLSHVGYGDMERGRVLIGLDHLLEVCRVTGRPISWFVGEMPEGLPALDGLTREIVELAERLPERQRYAVLTYTRFMAENAKESAEEGQQ